MAFLFYYLHISLIYNKQRVISPAEPPAGFSNLARASFQTYVEASIAAAVLSTCKKQSLYKANTVVNIGMRHLPGKWREKN
jgi:hypothetical protein